MPTQPFRTVTLNKHKDPSDGLDFNPEPVNLELVEDDEGWLNEKANVSVFDIRQQRPRTWPVQVVGFSFIHTPGGHGTRLYCWLHSDPVRTDVSTIKTRDVQEALFYIEENMKTDIFTGFRLVNRQLDPITDGMEEHKGVIEEILIRKDEILQSDAEVYLGYHPWLTDYHNLDGLGLRQLYYLINKYPVAHFMKPFSEYCMQYEISGNWVSIKYNYHNPFEVVQCSQQESTLFYAGNPFYVNTNLRKVLGHFGFLYDRYCKFSAQHLEKVLDINLLSIPTYASFDMYINIDYPYFEDLKTRNLCIYNHVDTAMWESEEFRRIHNQYKGSTVFHNGLAEDMKNLRKLKGKVKRSEVKRSEVKRSEVNNSADAIAGSSGSNNISKKSKTSTVIGSAGSVADTRTSVIVQPIVLNEIRRVETSFFKSKERRLRKTSIIQRVFVNPKFFQIGEEYMCPYKDCDLRFVTRSCYKRHASRIHKPFKCPWCPPGVDLEPANRFFEHIADKHEITAFVCYYCRNGYETQKKLSDHQREICDKKQVKIQTEEASSGTEYSGKVKTASNKEGDLCNNQTKNTASEGGDHGGGVASGGKSSISFKGETSMDVSTDECEIKSMDNNSELVNPEIIRNEVSISFDGSAFHPEESAEGTKEVRVVNAESDRCCSSSSSSSGKERNGSHVLTSRFSECSMDVDAQDDLKSSNECTVMDISVVLNRSEDADYATVSDDGIGSNNSISLRNVAITPQVCIGNVSVVEGQMPGIIVVDLCSDDDDESALANVVQAHDESTLCHICDEFFTHQNEVNNHLMRTHEWPRASVIKYCSQNSVFDSKEDSCVSVMVVMHE